MKRFLLSAVIAAATLTAPAVADDVGVSVSIGQPGFYGQINIGDYPQPRVIYAQPRIIERGISMNREPVYLRVPPGHARNWKHHCREYHACGERVF
jgi:opacity protein-like surface antigen